MKEILLFFIFFNFFFNFFISKPIIIGHRGASYKYPEHTFASHLTACAMGVDYTELDLLPTKDLELIVVHSPNLVEVTNVEDFPEFSDRKRWNYNIGGEYYTGFFIQDFTLAEIKRLRSKQRWETRNQKYNGLFPLITLNEILQALDAFNIVDEYSTDSKTIYKNKKNKDIGIYMETKKSYHNRLIGLSYEDKLLSILEKFNYVYPNKTLPNQWYSYNNTISRKIFIESFESTSLTYIHSRVPDIPLIMLLDPPNRIQNDTGKPYSELMTDQGLKYLSGFCKGIGPEKSNLLIDGDIKKSNELVANSHKNNLLVHPFWFRADQIRKEWKIEKPIDEYFYFFRYGVDGVFSDNPDIAILALKVYSEDDGSVFWVIIVAIFTCFLCLVCCGFFVGCVFLIILFALKDNLGSLKEKNSQYKTLYEENAENYQTKNEKEKDNEKINFQNQ